MNGPDTIRLVRGAVPPDAERVLTVPPPALVELAAGQGLDATVHLPLPLTAWHNAGAVTALRPAKTITLEVAIYATRDSAPRWLRGAAIPAP